MNAKTVNAKTVNVKSSSTSKAVAVAGALVFWTLGGPAAHAAPASFFLSDQESEVYYGFAVATGGQIQVEEDTDVTGNVHSNDKIDLKPGSRVTGDVSAAGDITSDGIVSGSVQPGAAPLDLPELADPSLLRQLADRVLSGDQVLSDEVVDDVVFVEGKVEVFGSLDGSGTIIATAEINLMDGAVGLDAGTRLSLISFKHIEVGKDRPVRAALRAQEFVIVEEGATVEGVIVADQDVTIKKSSTVTFLDFDEVPPEITVLAPGDGSFVATTTPEIRATFVDDFSGLRAGSLEFLLDGVDTTPEVLLEEGTLSFTLSAPLSDGLHTMEIAITDHSGNEARVTSSFTVDTLPPVLTLVSPAAPEIPIAEVPPAVVDYSDATSGVDLATLAVVLDGQALADCTVDTASATCAVPELAIGPHVLTVSLADLAGNAANLAFDFEVVDSGDSEGPVVRIAAPNEARLFNDPSPGVEVEYSDADSGVDLTTLELRVDDIDLLPGCTVTPSSAACEPPSLAAGRHDVLVALSDLAGNQTINTFAFELELDTEAPLITLIGLADGQVVSESPLAVAGTVSDAGLVGSVRINGADSSVTEGAFAATVALEVGANPIRVEAIDTAGNSAAVELTVNLIPEFDPPVLTILAPLGGAFVLEKRPALDVLFDDESGVDPASLTWAVNGQPLVVSCALEDDRANCVPDVDLPEGALELTVGMSDVFGNSTTATVAFELDSVPIEIGIDAPANLFITRDENLGVSGTVSDENAAVTVNGVAVASAGNTFQSTVVLREGVNMVVATATRANGRTATATIEVIRDVLAPVVRIETPSDGLPAVDDTVTVTGRVVDVIQGTQPEVRVNGLEALVNGGTFLLTDLPLVRGPNVIEAVAVDAAGNESRHSVQVELRDLAGPRIKIADGNGQFERVNQTLAQPLVALVTDSSGNPLAGRLVRFEVARNNGLLGTDPAATNARVVQVPSDGAGRAAVFLTLGDTLGEGNNRVRATSAGVAGEAEFCASALPGIPEKVLMADGDNQRGAVGQALARPFEALVVDKNGNPIAGFDVTFRVDGGGGHLDGQPEIVRATGPDGIARAVLTLGPQPGITNNSVIATFADLPEVEASFVASGLEPGPAAATRMSGVVLDNSHLPIPGALVEVDGAATAAFTDAEGRFEITGVPVGLVGLNVDPSNSPRPETFPPLHFEVVTVSGQDNDVGQPIRLPAVDTANSKIVGGSEDVTLLMPEVEGLTLTVFANSTTFPDGSPTGRLSISQVQQDKVPMSPPTGSLFMPPAWTIQPSGVVFDPPARITIPNDGLEPGRVIDIFQFDHALDQFINVGRGTVDESAFLIASDPGFGITRSGWGGCGPPQPPDTCAANCTDDNVCTRSFCRGGRCVDEPRDGVSCADGKFCTNNQCFNGRCTSKDKPPQKIPEVTVEFQKLNEAINALRQWLAILQISDFQIPDVSGSFAKSGEKACCEAAQGFEEKSKWQGEFAITGLETGEITPTVPPFSGDYTVTIFGKVIGGEYGVFVSAKAEFKTSIAIEQDDCTSKFCGSGAFNLSGGGSGGIKAEVENVALGTCGPNNDMQCSLLRLAGFFSTGLSVGVNIECDKIVGPVTHSGIAFTAEVQLFEGTFFEVKGQKKFEIIPGGPVADLSIELPRN